MSTDFDSDGRNASYTRSSTYWLVVAFGAIAVCLVIAIVALLRWMSYESDYVIEFHIPNKYRGPIILREDSTIGVMPVERDGHTLVYRIPKDGRLIVRSLAPFQRYHSTRAFYDNGDELRTIHTMGNSPDDVVMRYVGSHVNGSLEFIIHVGDMDEFRELRRQVGVESEGVTPRNGRQGTGQQDNSLKRSE